MVEALFDTNILIDYLGGIPAARDELAKFEAPAISLITWMEVMVGADAAVARATEQFLASFHLIALDTNIARRAVKLRRQHRTKLPDAIVWASAQAHGMLLITRDEKAFPANDPGIRVPYRT